MNHFKIVKMGNVIGIISVAFFLLCMAWGLVLTDPALKELHTNILRIVYPGFAISSLGVILGIIESFIYGWIFGVLFAWLCNKARVWENHR